MEITVSRTEGEVPVTILRLDGELDALTTEQAQKQAELEIDMGAQNILLDMSGVPFMSSSGVRMIYALFNMLHPLSSSEEDLERAKQMREGVYAAPHLKILSPTKQVLNVMKMVGIDSYIDIFDDEDDAVAAFATTTAADNRKR